VSKSQLEGMREAIKVHSETPRKALRVAIGSGKGGVGKTTFALSLGISRVKAGEAVLLLDVDPGLPDLNIFLGINPDTHWGHFVKGEKTLAEVVLRNVKGMDFVHGFSGVTDPSWMQGKAAQMLLDGLHTEVPNYDWMILDVGAGLSEPNLVFMTSVDFLVLVVSPELTSLADAYGTLKTALARNPGQKIGVVVNQAETVEQARNVYLNLAKIAAQFLGVRIPLIGWLPRDPEVPRSLARQSPIVSERPESPYAQGIFAIANAIVSLTRGSAKE
jgi:flagellar biosynthesis protein FlhG